ncbi:hypothetical protein ACWJWQ_09250, partial [Clostridioides difficile]
YLLLIYYFWLHFHAGKCQLMQGIFQKENTDKALKYGIYRHLPTYEKIIRNLVSFSNKKRVDYDKLFDEFRKILNRELTKDEKKIINLAYNMGKTNQFTLENVKQRKNK